MNKNKLVIITIFILLMFHEIRHPEKHYDTKNWKFLARRNNINFDIFLLTRTKLDLFLYHKLKWNIDMNYRHEL